VKKIYQRLPSLGLGYLAAVLEKAGHDVKVYNGPIGEDIDYTEIRDIIQKFKPDLIGFGVMTPVFHRAIEVTEYIKKHIDTSITVILGGSHITSLPEETLRNFPIFDAGIVGEGEHTIIEFMDYLSGKRKLDSIKGIVYAKKNGKVILTESRPLIQNLDEIPFPARHLLDLENQRYSWFVERGVHMVTSRGCPNRCKFCDHAIFGKTNRVHSVEYVIKEIEHVINTYKAKEIIFLDDNFTLNTPRLKTICNEMIKRKIDIRWQCYGRVNNASPELYRLMKKAGCWSISYGIESGNQEVLNFINKDITKEQVRKAVCEAKKAGIQTRGSFMIGHPIDTKETVLQTINFAKTLPLDNVGFSIFVPYPGSEFFRDVEKYGTFRRDKYYTNFNRSDNDPVFIPRTMTKEEIHALYTKAQRDFFLRPSYILRSLRNLQSPKHFSKYFFGFCNIMLRDVLGKRTMLNIGPQKQRNNQKKQRRQGNDT
jgi:anaerobic magnesium-protoporphyrin IX monomethyl ester cyclase